MTNLDDLTALQRIDREGMLGHVAALPQQCRGAWALTRPLKVPTRHLRANTVLISGMGGSAIGGDLAVAVAADQNPLPIVVHRDYGLPAHVDRQTLVIASSYSGNTEETLSAFQAAHERGCPLLAITTGGELARLAREWNAPCISFEYQSQPRAALGYMFLSLLGILQALGIAGGLEADLEEALAILETQGVDLVPENPQAHNEAKQLALELADCLPIIVGAGPLAAVARRWKTQFNENSKTWACFEPLPEMNHNALSGIHFPPEMADRVHVLFLRNAGLHPRNQLRLDLTMEILEKQGISCQPVSIPGSSKLAQVLSAIQLGDYVSCYLALLNAVDPTDIQDIIGLKQRMADR
jgi:glucose/mannose-6-phosphate isomerase